MEKMTKNGEVVQTAFPNPLAWKFMNEPLWRWFMFILAMNLLLAAWVGVLRFMRD